MKKDRRFGTFLSIALHLVLLGSFIMFFRQPVAISIVAAGEGQGEGESAIEVGLVEASLLSPSQQRAVSFFGESDETINNQMVETLRPENAEDAELLPSDEKRLNRDQRSSKTDRPTPNRSDQLVSQKPLQGRSSNTNIEVGRSYGSQTPSLIGGIGVGSGSGTAGTGVPGGSEYGRRIQAILSRNYNPPSVSDSGSTQYVIVQLRIARDGRIMSLANGRLSATYIKRRSSIELVNYAAERAILASNPLPPFPNGFLMGAQEAIAEIWFRYPK